MRQPSPTPTPVAAPDTITILMSQEPDVLLPGAGNSTQAREEVLAALWTDLVMRDDKNEYVAWGAESVPTVDNGGAKFVGDGGDKHLEVTFKIKKGLKWQDGNPVTSQDIKFTIELLQNPDFPATERTLSLKVADVLTPDDQTAVLQFMSENQAKKAAAEGWKYDNKDFYQDYANQSGPVLDPLYFTAADAGAHILPSHIVGKINPKDLPQSEFARKPVGDGPYKLRDWAPGERIVLEAAATGVFGPPKTDTIIYSIKADAPAVLAALATGEGQVATQIDLDADQSPELDKLEQQGKLKAYYVPATAYEHVSINLQVAALQDTRVRQALIYAMDRQAIVDKVLHGRSEVMNSWLAPSNWAYDDAAVTKYDFDLAKAKQLLTEAGYAPGADGILAKDGKPLKLTMITTTSKVRQTVGPLLQADLKQVGIDLAVEYLPANDFTAKLVGRKFDLALFRFTSDEDPDPTPVFHSANCPDGINFSCWRNEQADHLMSKAASSLSQEERKPLYSQLLRIWTEEVPDIPLFQSVNVSATTPSLQNFRPPAARGPETWNVHEWALAGQSR
ncbi:MAG: peptide ABC transporter substrate-binding protein [Chloroflexota bacterium]